MLHPLPASPMPSLSLISILRIFCCYFYLSTHRPPRVLGVVVERTYKLTTRSDSDQITGVAEFPVETPLICGSTTDRLVGRPRCVALCEETCSGWCSGVAVGERQPIPAYRIPLCFNEMDLNQGIALACHSNSNSMIISIGTRYKAESICLTTSLVSLWAHVESLTYHSTILGVESLDALVPYI